MIGWLNDMSASAKPDRHLKLSPNSLHQQIAKNYHRTMDKYGFPLLEQRSAPDFRRKTKTQFSRLAPLSAMAVSNANFLPDVRHKT